MTDMIEKAKSIIKKGQLLKDPELIQMGMDLLQEYEVVDSEPNYHCTNCGHSMPKDKERKRCPECKKHTLVINMPSVPVDKKDESFISPINGNIVQAKKGTKRQPVQGFTNTWKDEDRAEGQDKANELLKQFTKHTERTRETFKYVNKTCAECGTTYKENPAYLVGSSRYVCVNCRGRGRIR